MAENIGNFATQDEKAKSAVVAQIARMVQGSQNRLPRKSLSDHGAGPITVSSAGNGYVQQASCDAGNRP